MADPILSRLASEVGRRTKDTYGASRDFASKYGPIVAASSVSAAKSAASVGKSALSASASMTGSGAAKIAGAAAAGAAAAGGGSKNLVVKGFNAMKPKASVPWYVLVIATLFQFFDIFTKYQLPTEMRAFIYFSIAGLAVLTRMMSIKQAISVFFGSMLLPFLWQLVNEYIPDSEISLPIKMAFLVISPIWAWIFLASYAPGSFFGEVLRLAVFILIMYGILWPQVSTIMYTYGLGDYKPDIGNVDPLKIFQEGMKSSFETLQKIPVAISEAFENQISLATGDFYGGKEDQTKEKLGVFIEDFKPDEPSYYEGDIVTAAAEIKARTLANPIKITPKCWADKDRRDMVEGIIHPGEIEVDSLEQDIFDCKFAKKLKKGTHTLTAAATFNFETDAHLTRYFINKEERREMQHKEIDPFDVYKIVDRNPVAEFSNGPVHLGIGGTEPLEGIDSDSQLAVGVSLKNNWQGKILSLSSLTIELPKGFEVAGTDACSHKFNFAKTDDDGFSVYELDIKAERAKNKDKFTDIKEFQNFRCRVKIKPGGLKDILGKTGISIVNFRSSTKYTYSTEKDVTVEIKEKQKPGKGEEPVTSSEPSEPYEIPESKDVIELVKFYAGKYGVDKETALMVASQEGGFQHYGGTSNWQETSGGQASGNCDEGIKCGDGGCSVGAMQINVCDNAHPQCMGPVVYEPSSSDMCIGALSCAGTGVNDIKCNIEAAIRLLKASYDEGVTNPVSSCVCDETYTGWKYAMRRYNGCACGDGHVEAYESHRDEVSAYI